VLIVGDSVTHGSSGDWTWRFRLWQHVRSTSERPIEFVGPRDDLHDYLVDQNGNHDYVDPGFDRHHAARWGMTLAFADTPVDELVETYQPDVVVEMLGTNDLLFLNRTPTQVEQDIESFVTVARSADPDVDVVLAEVTQTWFTGAPELNDLLADGATALDTVASRVLLADTDGDYTSTAHTFDGSHPNAQGEAQIAGAVADSLAALGIGAPATRPLPSLPLGPRIPVVLNGTFDGRRMTLDWVRSPGAPSTQISWRDASSGTPWTVIADDERGTVWSSQPLPPGHTIQFRALPRKGWLLARSDVTSNVVTATVPAVPGRPLVTVAPRPRGRVVLVWAGAPGATFEVQLKRIGRSGWRVVAANRSRQRLVLRELRSGARYAARVRGSNVSGIGPWSARVRFTVPTRER
jgi:GDSL-like Lipase/Acylhydrolase family